MMECYCAIIHFLVALITYKYSCTDLFKAVTNFVLPPFVNPIHHCHQIVMLLLATVRFIAHWIAMVRSRINFGHPVPRATLACPGSRGLTLTPGCYQLEADTKLVLDDKPSFFVTMFHWSKHQGLSQVYRIFCQFCALETS